jgi:plastocyanin
MKKLSGRRRYMAALAAPAALVAVAACGGTISQSYGSSTEPPTEPSPPAKPMPGMSIPGMSMPGTSMPKSPGTSEAGDVAATRSVSISNFAYGPASITVKVRSTVTWTNGDQAPHTVTSQNSGGPLQSATMNKGQTYKYTFTKTGSYPYLCTLHPFMTGTVVVTP